MTSMTEIKKCKTIICQGVEKIFGSLNKGAVVSTYGCAIAAFMLVGFLTLPSPNLVDYLVPRLLDFTFLVNITLLFGIETGPVDLLRAVLITNPVLAVVYCLTFIYSCIITRFDIAATTGTFAVIIAVQHVIIRELLNTRTKEADEKTFNEEGVHQNVSVQTNDKMKLVSPDLPAVFSTKTYSNTSA